MTKEMFDDNWAWAELDKRRGLSVAKRLRLMKRTWHWDGIDYDWTGNVSVQTNERTCDEA